MAAAAFARHQVDRARDRARPEEVRVRPAQHLHAVDGVDVDGREIERAALDVGGVVERDAVEQDQREVGVTAARERVRRAGEPTGAEQVDAGHTPHQLGNVVRLRALDPVPIEHVGRGGRRLGGARRDGDLFLEVGGRDGIGSRRGRLCEREGCEEEGASKRPYKPKRGDAGALQGLGSFFPK